VLGTFGRLELELGDTSLCDAAGHGQLDGACGVVLVKSKTEITGCLD
jgi:hypothetical protein